MKSHERVKVRLHSFLTSVLYRTLRSDRFSPKKQPLVSSSSRLNVPQTPSKLFGGEETLLLLPGIELRFLGRPARQLVAILSGLSQLHALYSQPKTDGGEDFSDYICYSSLRDWIVLTEVFSAFFLLSRLGRTCGNLFSGRYWSLKWQSWRSIAVFSVFNATDKFCGFPISELDTDYCGVGLSVTADRLLSRPVWLQLIPNHVLPQETHATMARSQVSYRAVNNSLSANSYVSVITMTQLILVT